MSVPHEIEKAITLLASLPEIDALYLLGELSSARIDTLAEYVALQENVSEDRLHDIFVDITDRATRDLRNNARVAPAKMEAVNVNGSPQNPADIGSPSLAPLADLNADGVYSLVQDELPQTIAAILHHLPENTVGRVLRRLPTDKQTEVVKRLAKLEPLTPEVVADLAMVLVSRLEQRRKPLQRQATGTLRIACLLNNTDQATGSALLENLAQEDRDLIHDVQPALLVLRHLDRLRHGPAAWSAEPRKCA